MYVVHTSVSDTLDQVQKTRNIQKVLIVAFLRYRVVTSTVPYEVLPQTQGLGCITKNQTGRNVPEFVPEKLVFVVKRFATVGTDLMS